MRTIVTGGRDYDDWFAVQSMLDALHAEHGITYLAQGGATGADALAKRWAGLNDIPCETFEADWDRYPGHAGRMRNCRMLREAKADACLSLPGGRGTRHMTRIAKEVGLQIYFVSDS